MDKINAILNLRPNSVFSLVGGEIIWLDNEQTQPSEEEILEEISKINIQKKATKYQRDRKSEYDKLNQDELRYNDLVNGTNTWIEAIQEIKAKYPKPE